MSSKNDLEDLFKKWEELNNKVQSSFGNFNFDKIKEIRVEQRKIEDEIYSILLANASDDLKVILPEDCGEMEIGFNGDECKFYFLMIDPEQDFEEEAPVKINAIVINIDRDIEIIEDFKIEE